MTATPMMQMASARAGLDSALAQLNVGGVAGTISIWSGALPATCETADDGTAAHKLSTLTLSVTSFGNSTDPGGTGLATATANAITSDTNAAHTGTAGYFRGYCSGSGAGSGGANGCVIQGTVGTSAADFIINTTSIVSGSTVACSSWVVTLADGSGAD